MSEQTYHCCFRHSDNTFKYVKGTMPEIVTQLEALFTLDPWGGWGQFMSEEDYKLSPGDLSKQLVKGLEYDLDCLDPGKKGFADKIRQERFEEIEKKVRRITKVPVNIRGDIYDLVWKKLEERDGPQPDMNKYIEFVINNIIDLNYEKHIETYK